MGASEANIIELTGGGKIVRRTVANATSISKGTICVLTDPNTCTASAVATLATEAFGGILMEDKLASDGSTTASFLIGDAVVDLVNSGTAITVGDAVVMSGANLIMTALAANLLTGSVIGTAEETASNGERIRVRM